MICLVSSFNIYLIFVMFYPSIDLQVTYLCIYIYFDDNNNMKIRLITCLLDNEF